MLAADGLLGSVQHRASPHSATSLLGMCFGKPIYTFLFGIQFKVDVLSRRVCIFSVLEGSDKQLYKVLLPIRDPVSHVFNKKF